jgi:ABC-type glutathione transport system ATPase component
MSPPAPLHNDDALLRVSNLTVTYRPERGILVKALRQVSLAIRPGEIVGVQGESGSGKSTLALAVSRLLPVAAAVSGGSVWFPGLNLLTLSEWDMQHVRGRRISFLGQDPTSALNPGLRVGEQVSTPYWWMIVPGFLLVPIFLSYYILARSFESRVESSPY